MYAYIVQYLGTPSYQDRSDTQSQSRQTQDQRHSVAAR